MLQQILSLSRRFKAVGLVPALLLCAACQREVLNPAGDVARQQRDIIYISTGLMPVSYTHLTLPTICSV